MWCDVMCAMWHTVPLVCPRARVKKLAGSRGVVTNLGYVYPQGYLVKSLGVLEKNN